MRTIISLTLTVFMICSMGCHQVTTREWTDVNYAGDTTTPHLLDIYLPEEGNGPFPAVIVIYGSAWFSNNLKATAFDAIGQPLLNNGFAVVAINHRASTDAIFPAQIHDVKAAVRFIRANGNKHHIDPSFIGITGFSSGGHLSALVGTTGNVREYTVEGITLDIEGYVGAYVSTSSHVDAVVDWFGPTDFQVMDSCGSEMEHNVPDSPESSLVGGPIQENDAMCALANPITYVDPEDPPFLILHGDADPLVPYCNSIALYDALQESGVESEFILVPEGGHGPGLFTEAYFKMMTDFFLSQLNE